MTPRPITLPGRVVDPGGVEYRPEDILHAVRRWAAEHGEPPTVADWDPARAARIGQSWRAARFAAGDWPAAETVRRAFRTFNAAVEAAGLTPQPTPRRSPPPPPPPQLPRHTPGSGAEPQWRAVALATADAAAEARRPGVEQFCDRLRALAAARDSRDAGALRAELVRVAGSALAWADALVPPTR